VKIFNKNQTDEIIVELKAGRTVVFPTETSYGLGCDAKNKEAVEKIFQIKKRDYSKPLLVIVDSIEEAKKYLVWNKNLNDLAKKYWPGPLTIIGYCKNPQAFPYGVVSSSGKLAVRVSANGFLREITAKLGGPLVATSANLSGQSEIYKFEDITNTFIDQEKQPDILVDGQDLPLRKPTTLVNVEVDKIQLLRQGETMIKLSENKKDYFYFCLLAIASFFSGFFILVWSSSTVSYIEGMNNAMLMVNVKNRHFAGVKNPLIKVKGIYLTAYSAGSSKKMEQMISLIKKTELNAVVIDIKDYSGLVLYDSQVPLVVSLKNKDNRLGDVKKLIEKLHAEKIYVIARQTVFQDPVLAEKKPEWAIKSQRGGLWRDKKGLSWVDPTKKEVWKYNLAIAKEAIQFGFDEINFDYVRFPSDGNMADTLYDEESKKKYEVMGEFYRFLNNNFKNDPVWISLDLFGFTMEKNGVDDMSIGQRIADTVDNVDYVCPMMYPSHYPSGHLGLINPAANPGLVFENGMKIGAPKFEGKRAQVRPWIQAFDMGAVYDAEKIRAQIEVVEKYANAGWLMWNASNRYTDAGLK